jgi:hypothetical protein
VEVVVRHMRGEMGIELSIENCIPLVSSIRFDRNLELEEEIEIIEHSGPG